MTSQRAQAELRQLERGLIVSCQAREDNPLHGPQFMAAMAAATVEGGAAGIRADGVTDIRAIRQRIGPRIPIMGILKTRLEDGSLFITATSNDARQIIESGASLVALDGTRRPRPGSESLRTVIDAIHDAGGATLADVGTVDHAAFAIECGADAVGTTLSGYTPDSPRKVGPDFDLLSKLVALDSVPVFAEGRIWTREEARNALDLGASFVVVGTAITNPMAITSRFVAALKQ